MGGAFDVMEKVEGQKDLTVQQRKVAEWEQYMVERDLEQREYNKVRHQMRMDQMNVYNRYRQMIDDETYENVPPVVQEKVARNLLALAGHVAPTKTEISLQNEHEQQAAVEQVYRNLIANNIIEGEIVDDNEDDNDGEE